MVKLEDSVQNIDLSIKMREHEKMINGARRFGIGAALSIAGLSFDYEFFDNAFRIVGGAYMGWNLYNVTDYIAYKWNEHKRKGERR